MTLAEPGTYVALYNHQVVLQIRSGVSGVQESRWVLQGNPVEVEVPETVEEGSRIRHRFLEWSEGETPFSPMNVVAPLAPMTLEVAWAKEYRITVEGPAGVELDGSCWYPQGTALVLQAPAEVEEGNESKTLRFASWESMGLPVLPAQDAQGRTLTVTVDAPYTLRARYAEVPEVKEYQVTLEGPVGVTLEGSGVYTEGTSLVIRAPDVVDLDKQGERLRFDSWEATGNAVRIIPDPQSPTTTITVDAPFALRADYRKQYFVIVTAPSGTLQRGWFEEGQELLLEVPTVEEIVPELVRLVFKGWQGQEGLSSTRISGVVNQPVNLSAVYERQFMVTVGAPYGSSGGGWQRVGNLVTVAVPDNIQSKLIFRKSFQGFAGYLGDQPSIEVRVDAPTIIAATYNNDVDLGVLSLLLVIPLAAVLVYFANRWVLLLVRRRNVFVGSADAPGVIPPGGQEGPE